MSKWTSPCCVSAMSSIPEALLEETKGFGASRGAARRVAERGGVRRRRAAGGGSAYFGGGRYSDDDVADEAAPWHVQQACFCLVPLKAILRVISVF